MKIMRVFFITLSVSAMDFIGWDDDESFSVLARQKRFNRGKKFEDYYNKLKSKTKLVITKTTLDSPSAAAISTTTKATEYMTFPLENPYEKTFKSEFNVSFENFDPRLAASSDPVYQETMAKIEQLNSAMTNNINFERGNFDHARKLVVDNSWKELDKFTKLMDMIMYLQFEPVFGKYCFYGCWCMPSGGQDLTKVWGQPVDEIDSTCRDMQMCYKCAKIDYGNNCKDTIGYKYKGYEENGERKIRCMDKQDTCKRALCECDKRLATQLAKLEDTSNSAFHSKYGEFNFQKQCVPQCKNCHKWDTCCGEYPTRFPFWADQGNRQCCPDGKVRPYGECKNNIGY